jgi:hypothetical protein
MKHFFAAAAFACAIGTASAGTIVFQDNFSSGAPNYIQDDTTTGLLFTNANFSLTSGSIDLNGPNPGPGFYTQLCQGTANYCIDTTGGSSQYGTITSASIALAPGSYELTFDLFGWDYLGLTETGEVNVKLGSLVNQTYDTNGATPFSGPDVVYFTVASSTSASLVFQDTGNNHSSSFAGSVLDNIEIQSVPEPSSLILAGAAIAGLAALRLRKA